MSTTRTAVWRHGKPRIAFISGGGSGLGLQIVHSLLKDGCDVVIFDQANTESLILELRSVCVNDTQKVKGYRVDITDPIALDDAIESAVELIGVPDFALNSAGILRTEKFTDLPFATFKKVIDINLIGSRNFSFSVLKHMKPGGYLALVASLAGIVGSYTQSAYAASKFGVVGLAEVLRAELKLEGISVSVVCPGEIDSPLLKYEREHGSPITEMLNEFAGVLSVDEAVKGILKGLRKREYMITPGFKAKLTRVLARKSTSLLHWIVDRKLAKACGKTVQKI